MTTRTEYMVKQSYGDIMSGSLLEGWWQLVVTVDSVCWQGREHTSKHSFQGCLPQDLAQLWPKARAKFIVDLWSMPMSLCLPLSFCVSVCLSFGQLFCMSVCMSARLSVCLWVTSLRPPRGRRNMVMKEGVISPDGSDHKDAQTIL